MTWQKVSYSYRPYASFSFLEMSQHALANLQKATLSLHPASVNKMIPQKGPRPS